MRRLFLGLLACLAPIAPGQMVGHLYASSANQSLGLSQSAGYTPVPPALSATTIAWDSAVRANAGSASWECLAAVETFVAGCTTDGIFSTFSRVNLLAGDNLAAAVVPLVTTGGNSTDTITNYVAGDYTEAVGLTKTSITGKYLRTGLTVSGAVGGCGIFISAQGGSAVGDFIGARQATPTVQRYGIRWNGSAAHTMLGQYGGNVNSNYDTGGAGTPAPKGLWAATRVSSTSQILTYNGVAQATTATSVSAATPNGDVAISTTNNAGAFGGAPAAVGTVICFYYVEQTGFSTAQILQIYGRLQTFNAVFGR